jgi:hypothetical protein
MLLTSHVWSKTDSYNKVEVKCACNTKKENNLSEEQLKKWFALVGIPEPPKQFPPILSFLNKKKNKPKHNKLDIFKNFLT